jgi:cold shock CspA family protein
MGKSQETFSKKEKEKKRLKRKKDKFAKRDERRANPKKTFEELIAYVDENGNLSDTPPDITKKNKIKAEDIQLGVPSRESEDVDPIKKGKLEFYNNDKGYGFIKEDVTNDKFFVHVSSINGEIIEGDKISFELEQGPKGLNAVRVNKI